MKRVAFIALYWRSMLVAIGSCILFSTPIFADPTPLTPFNMGRYGENHYTNQIIDHLTPEEIAEQVGAVKYVVNCPEGYDQPDTHDIIKLALKRTVTITLGKPGLEYRNISVLSTLLDGAIDHALEECPMNTSAPMGVGPPTDIVGEANIYARPKAGGALKHVGRVQGFSGLLNEWWHSTDLYADEEKATLAAEQAQADATALRETQEAQAASENAQLQQQADYRADVTARWEESQRQTRASVNTFFSWVEVFLVFAFFGWLYTKREPILRFYYFNFHPHPAAPMVRSIVEYGGDTSDITRGFAEALNEVPPHSRILRKVRLEQTEALVNDMKMANAAREREFARQAKNDAIASFEREAFYGSQQAIALAVEALERSKRAYATATELRGREI